MSPEGTQRRLAAILHADVEGYSRLMAEAANTGRSRVSFKIVPLKEEHLKGCRSSAG